MSRSRTRIPPQKAARPRSLSRPNSNGRIIGEYAERIDNADELLESFLESFEDETPQVHIPRCS